MNNILETINSLGGGFVDFALPMLIQSGILIVILLGADLILHKQVRAVFRYWLWMLVLLKLVLPPTISTPISFGQIFGDRLSIQQSASVSIEEGSLQSPEYAEIEITTKPIMVKPLGANSTESSTDVTPQQTAHAITEKSQVQISWQAVVFLIWLAVVLSMVLLLVQRVFFVAGLIRQAQPANGIMNETFQFCRKRMKVKQLVKLKVSPNATSPAVCGLFRPVILVPNEIGPNLGLGALRQVLMHELAHIKRGDLWLNLAQTLLQLVYFYNPLLWLANAVIRRIREQAVDEAVQAALGEKAAEYPETLLNVAKLAFNKPALSLRFIGVVESKSQLNQRIKKMLTQPFPKSAKLSLAGLIAIIITAAILLPMAQAVPPPEFIIKGTVTDAETGRPIAGAKVGDSKKYNSGKFFTITDSNGYYEYKTWYEEHDTIAETDGYKSQQKGFGTKLFVQEKEKVIDYQLTPEKTAEKPVSLKPNFNTDVQIEVDPKNLNTDSSARQLQNIQPKRIKDILEKVESKYASMQTYQSKGKTVSEIPITAETSGGLARPFEINSQFSIALARDGKYFIEWSQKVHQSFTYNGAVWSIGKGDWMLFLGKKERMENKGMALGAAAGVSNGATMAMPSLFFGEQLPIFSNLRLEPEEEINGNNCFVISGQMRGNTYVYWVSKETYLIHQMRTVYQNIDLPEEIEKDMPAEVRSMNYEKMTSTQTYQDIIIDESIPDEKFVPREAEKTAEEKYSFVPVIERIIYSSEIGKDFFFDIDNNKTFTPSSSLTRTSPPEEVMEWSLKNGIDFLNDRGSFELSPQTVFVRVSDELWEAPFEEVSNTYHAGYPEENIIPQHGKEPIWPLTYAFETRQGGFGLLQMLERNNGNIKFRYKMAQKNDPQIKDEKAIENSESLAALSNSVTNEMVNSVEAVIGQWFQACRSNDPVMAGRLWHNENDLGDEFKEFREILANEPEWQFEGINEIILPEPNHIIASSNGCRFIDNAFGEKSIIVWDLRKVDSGRWKIKQLSFSPLRKWHLSYKPFYLEEFPNVQIWQSETAPEPNLETQNPAEQLEKTQVTDPQSLINDAKVGGTVILPAGTYTKPIRIDKSLILKGQSQEQCVFEVTANEPAILVDTKGKGRVRIENLIIKWQLATSDKDIEMPVALAIKDSRAEIINCNFVPLGNSSRSPGAIRVIGFSNVDIDSCRTNGFEYVISYAEGTEGRVTNCAITNPGHQGIINYRGSKLNITRNIITGSKFHAIRSTGGTIIVRDNLLIANANRGIYLGNKTAYAAIENNLIMNNALGIDGLASSRAIITNNLIADSSYAGVGMLESTQLTVKDNIFYKNKRGLVLGKDQDKGKNNILKNTFWENEVDAENFEMSPQPLSVNPEFADPAGGNFSLAPGPAQEHKQGLSNPKAISQLWLKYKELGLETNEDS